MERSVVGTSRWRDVALAASLVLAGVGLMLNPLYLPVSVAEPTTSYVHTVQPADVSTPEYPGNPIAYDELPPDARDVFDRARREREAVIGDPGDRIDRFAYPTEPAPEEGLYLIERDGQTYELWTRTVESEGTVVLVQRLLVQPIAFLLGFFGVVAGLLLGAGRSGGGTPSTPEGST
ncbi:MAG: hypothetical protein V5A46_07100 [Haloferacaceae archaeon]